MDKLTAVGHVLRELITNFGSVGFFFGPIFMGPWWAGACFSAAFVIDGLVEWHIAVQDDGFHALLDQMWLLLKQTWAWWKQKIWALPQQTSVLLQKTWAMLTDKMSALLQRLWALLKRIRALLLGKFPAGTSCLSATQVLLLQAGLSVVPQAFSEGLPGMAQDSTSLAHLQSIFRKYGWICKIMSHVPSPLLGNMIAAARGMRIPGQVWNFASSSLASV